MTADALQRRRRVFQIGFFGLFVLAPPLDLLRFDLTRGHAVLLGMDWTLGIDALITGEGSAVLPESTLRFRQRFLRNVDYESLQLDLCQYISSHCQKGYPSAVATNSSITLVFIYSYYTRILPLLRYAFFVPYF